MFTFLPDIILRSPLQSSNDFKPNNLQQQLTDPFFKLALYLASSSFYQLLEAKNFDLQLLTEKEQLTLLKYFNRICFRCTPFGFFSSVSILKWNRTQSEVQLSARSEVNLFILPDQQINLYRKGFNQPGPDDKIVLNPSLYKTIDGYRLIQTVVLKEGRVLYQLFDIEQDIILKKVIDHLSTVQLIPLERLSGFIISQTLCSVVESDHYIKNLFEIQVIQRPMDYSLYCQPGELPLLRGICLNLYSAFVSANKTPNFQRLQELQLLSLKIKRCLEKKSGYIPPEFYYTVSTRASSGGLNLKHQTQLKEALSVMMRLSVRINPTELSCFTKKFKARYDRQIVPLLQVLDPEMGLGYGTSSATGAFGEMLTDLPLKDFQNETDMPFHQHKAKQMFLKKWTSPQFDGKAIKISQDDLLQLELPEESALPFSTQVMFSFRGDSLLIESAGGAFAGGIIGRFTLLDTEINSLAHTIAIKEEEAHPEMIFAEVNHLLDAKTDNINCRRLNYKYIINTVSASNFGNSLPLSDLYVTSCNNEIVLYSKSLQKRVIPRFSSAYNYHKNDLGIFKFLCDLQYQNFHSDLKINLPALFPGLEYYPRVTYHQTILSEAQWYLSEAEIFQLSSGGGGGDRRLKHLIENRQFSRYIALTEGDQQLVIDLQDERHKLFFLKCLEKQKAGCWIKEYDLNQSDLIRCDQQAFAGQFIAFLVSDVRRFKIVPFNDSINRSLIQRNFGPGSEWLYLKIKVSSSYADSLLKKVYTKILRNTNHGVRVWYFVRYDEGGSHLRLRINLAQERLGDIMQAFQKVLKRDIDHHLVEAIQLDTYSREIERYGSDIIENVEKWFHSSSEFQIAFSKISQQNKAFHLCAFIPMLMADYLISQFLPSNSEQFAFVKEVMTSLLGENTEKKSLKVALDQKFRVMAKDFHYVIDNSANLCRDLKISSHVRRLRLHTSSLLIQVSHVKKIRRYQLLADLVHMHLNRMFIHRQRHHELVTYYFLYKKKLSEKALSNQCL
ncbi:thiopeptide-type bacteriocin biosynthesis protein [Mucilaginibacter sp. CSA2-8R]|uniref:lantibiotic dehydratase n=1 Tax=Mucilaginibacter sp. CSA2-8R TaxID=3141542 RepID=UPI00315C92AE